MKLCNNGQCFGCCACMNICPENAITMHEDETGAIVPRIDSEKCIGCGACEKVCPVLSPVNLNHVIECDAVWSKNNDVVKSSASAGLVTTLSRLIIQDGGVVFGTYYHNNHLIFGFADDYNKVENFQGSKYIHAYIGFSYRKVEKFLKQNKKVLFVGTPCQIAGLKTYLRKDHKNLFLVDLICHGTPPQKYLIEYMEKIMPKKEYDKVLFRGPEGEKTVAYNGERIVYLKSKSADLFYCAYAKSIINRENCYTCPYATIERVGDITAGDFWGLNKNDLIGDASDVPYISLALVNSKKGLQLMQNAKNHLHIEQRKIEDTFNGNKQLSTPCIRHSERDIFLEKYKNSDFVTALKYTSVYRNVQKNNFYFSMIKPLKKIKKIMNRGKKI